MQEFTLEEKIGQMFIVGFDGLTLPEELKTLIKEGKIGGVIYFKRNVKDHLQLLNLSNSIQNASKKVPLFIAIDQEGGRVSRLSEPFTQFPSAKVVGSYNCEEIAFNFGKNIAKELKSVGINLNFAPVMDIDSNPENPVIGDRAFGNTPQLVSKIGISVIKGFQSEGIMATAKHFPGHGDTFLDSHFALPIVEHDIKRLYEIEMQPFLNAVKAKVDLIMTAHVLYTKLDDKYPATLSKKIISKILREEFQYDGVVITDDLEMKAVYSQFGIEKSTLLAVKAGVDIILICGGNLDNYKIAYNTLKEAVYLGEILEERIEESFQRILKLKENYLKMV